MTIRPARERDIPRLQELLHQVCMVHHRGRPDLFRAGGSKYTDEELHGLLADPSRPILAAEDDTGTVRGYAFCVLQEDSGERAMTGRRTLYIDDLCVDETCRGQHVGQALYREALALARRLGCYNVTLNVWTCNEGAMRFYVKQGLKPQKIGMEVIL